MGSWEVRYTLHFLQDFSNIKKKQNKTKPKTAVHRQQHWINIKLGQIPGATGKPGFSESYWAGVICTATEGWTRGSGGGPSQERPWQRG